MRKETAQILTVELVSLLLEGNRARVYDGCGERAVAEDARNQKPDRQHNCRHARRSSDGFFDSNVTV